MIPAPDTLYRRWLDELWNGDVDGSFVAARWLAEGIYGGGLPGATAEPGTPVSFAGHDILRADGGRFTEYWVASEGLHMMAQLGV